MKKATKMIAMLAATLTTAAWMGTAHADDLGGAVCQPKAPADDAKLAYSGNKVANSATTTANVICVSGPGTNTFITVNDRSNTANITCTGFYYVTGILSNIGSKSSTGTGTQQLTMPTSPGIGETWAVDCSLPPATSLGQSSIERVQTN